MYETRPSLILRVKDPENAESWREFVELYQPLLVRYACREGLCHEDAEDVAQEILIKLLRVMPKFDLDSQKHFRGYLSRTVYNAVITWHRQRQRHERVQEAIREDELNRQLLNPEEPSREWSDDHHRRVLTYSMQQVRQRSKSPTKWVCFEQHLLLQRPAADVAAELGITTNLVFVNASRIHKEIRELCNEYDVELSRA